MGKPSLIGKAFPDGNYAGHCFQRAGWAERPPLPKEKLGSFKRDLFFSLTVNLFSFILFCAKQKPEKLLLSLTQQNVCSAVHVAFVPLDAYDPPPLQAR
jgi:hypothetical protein